MKVSLVTTLEQFAPFEASYNALLQKVGGIESLYYSLPQIRVSLDTFKIMGASLFFVMVVEGDEVLAVLPFHREKDGVFGLRRTLRFWGQIDSLYARNTHPTILAHGFQQFALDAAVSFLNTEAKNSWDTIWLSSIKMEDENIKYFDSICPGSVATLREYRYYCFKMDQDIGEYLGAKKMRNINCRRRRLDEDFSTFEIVLKEEVSAADLEEIRVIHSGRQNYKDNGGAFFEDPLENQYVSELLALWSENKCVHYYSLRVEDKLIAFQIMTHALGVSAGFVLAFDSNYKKYSPMRLLSYEAYRYEAERYQTQRIESGWGGDQRKADYSSDTYDLYNEVITNQCLRTRLVLRMIHRIYRFRQKFRGVDDVLIRLTTGRDED